MTTKLNNLPYLKDTRRHLRRNMTEAELVLWEVLKDKKLCGRKFRRQHSIGYYIADFYCSSEKLIIELDGQQHFTQEGIAKDIDRDTHLALMDKKVLRFENKEVINNLTGVLKQIKSEFK
ncbi:MAG: endonuclease domain-containing protein [Bacteroidales bacterium]|nr:endonuclease domain-containing protein [Bacteroidales bacterium]